MKRFVKEVCNKCFSHDLPWERSKTEGGWSNREEVDRCFWGVFFHLPSSVPIRRGTCLGALFIYLIFFFGVKQRTKWKRRRDRELSHLVAGWDGTSNDPSNSWTSGSCLHSISTVRIPRDFKMPKKEPTRNTLTKKKNHRTRNCEPVSSGQYLWASKYFC